MSAKETKNCPELMTRKTKDYLELTYREPILYCQTCDQTTEGEIFERSCLSDRIFMQVCSDCGAKIQIFH